MLSVIIPCFNSEKTVRESVASCYQQGLPENTFEIVLIDDGSTDGTRACLLQISEKYSNIRVLLCDENRGGAVARNMAIEAAVGNFIICVDSDDVLGPNVIPKMLDFAKTANLDGVLFEQTRFFSDDLSKYEVVQNSPSAEMVSFEDLFYPECGFLTQVNFLYSREIFLRVGGYCPGNPFDTQTFGIKAISDGAKVSVCPGTYYFHRRSIKSAKSYYRREVDGGMISINALLILEAISNQFHEYAVAEIVRFDIFKKNQPGLGTSLWDYICKLVRLGFADPNERESSRGEVAKAFTELCVALAHGAYEEAQKNLDKLLVQFNGITPVLFFFQLRINAGTALKGKAGGVSGAEIRSATEFIRALHIVKTPWASTQSRINRRIKAFGTYSQDIFMNKVANGLLGKVIRHGKSLIIEMFLERPDGKAFSTAYLKALEIYRKELSLIDCDKFLMPTWRAHLNAIQNFFSSGFNVNFLRNSIIKSTMFAHLNRRATSCQLSLICGYFGKSAMKSLLLETRVGRPILNSIFYRSSGNTIHHLSHLAKFGIEGRTNLDFVNTVVEWGGGYGNMARLFKKIRPGCTYVIVDLPVFSCIQYCYLAASLGVGRVNIMSRECELKPGLVNLVPLDESLVRKIQSEILNVDLFVSTWALSESNLYAQELARSLDYFNARHLLLAFQSNSAEFPVASQVTRISSSFEVHYLEEIQYMLGNYYLFAKNLTSMT